ncbi:hypothetical protein BH10BDE1_BH10BDE1_35260 [soil metagenome]
MIKIDNSAYGPVSDLYRSAASPETFFPLIGAVISNEQDGSVYVDNIDSPRQAYVEHHFGFAQIFGASEGGFESRLEKYLFKEVIADSDAKKIRLYGTFEPEFLLAHPSHEIRSERQRFRLDPHHIFEDFRFSPELEIAPASLSNIDAIDSKFGVVKRFWRNSDDFIEQAHAVVLSSHDELVAICYSAANSKGTTEIDVVTDERFRKRGFGKVVVSAYIKGCRAASLEPGWDCFTNNLGSMRLCESVGFKPFGSAYRFYTINMLRA